MCVCNNKCLFTSLCSPPYGEAVRSAARTLMLAFSQVPCVSGLCQTMHGDNLTSTELIHVRLTQTVATSAELTWVRWFKPCMKQSTTLKKIYKKKILCYLQAQGHSAGWYDQNLTFGGLIYWTDPFATTLSLMVHLRKPVPCVKIGLQCQGHSEGSKHHLVFISSVLSVPLTVLVYFY